LLLSAITLARAPSSNTAVLVAFVGQIGAIMTYPAVAPAILLCLSYFHPPTSSRMLLMYFSWFIAAVLAATLLISGINYLVSGHFGIEIAGWRCPHAGKSLAEITDNLTRYSVNAWFSAKEYPDVLLLGLMTFVLGFIDRCTYRLAI